MDPSISNKLLHPSAAASVSLSQENLLASAGTFRVSCAGSVGLLGSCSTELGHSLGEPGVGIGSPGPLASRGFLQARLRLFSGPSPPSLAMSTTPRSLLLESLSTSFNLLVCTEACIEPTHATWAWTNRCGHRRHDFGLDRSVVYVFTIFELTLQGSRNRGGSCPPPNFLFEGQYPPNIMSMKCTVYLNTTHTL